MALLPLQQSEAGQESFQQWVNWPIQPSPIQEIETTLFPVQEMRPFQRKIRSRNFILAPAIGQAAIFTATCPADEAWRLISVDVVQTDTVIHGIILRINYLIPGLATGREPRIISRRIVTENTDSPLYPSMNVSGIAVAEFDQRGGPAPEIMPGDQLEILDTTESISGNNITVLVRYELIPIPFALELDTVFVGQTF